LKTTLHERGGSRHEWEEKEREKEVWRHKREKEVPGVSSES